MSELNIPDYRLRVNLGSAEGTVLPYHYRQYVTGFIYKTLDNISPDKGKVLHDRGYFEDNRYKFFTHGLVAVEPRFSKDGLSSKSNRWMLWFSTADCQLLGLMEKSLALLSTISIGDTVFTIESVDKLPLRSKGGKFRCISPISVSIDGKYLTPKDACYDAILKSALVNRYKAWTGLPLSRKNIKFRFIRHNKRLERYKNFSIVCTSGEFYFDAPPDVVRFAQLVGLGSQNSIGMGVIA